MISIIIPTLNEEPSLPALLDDIHQQGAHHEVIVVDGGSRDRTLEVARDRNARTLVSRPGRGAALCIGAKAARGQVLLFVHADSTLLPGALDRIDEALSANAEIFGGNFRVVFDDDTPHTRWLTKSYARLRTVGIYYGDSGIFVRRWVYEALGGFRPIPIMEDLDFARRLERFGRTCCIEDPPLITSSRRFKGRRASEIFFRLAWLHVLFWLGASPEWLAEIYNAQARRPKIGEVPRCGRVVGSVESDRR